MLEQYYPILVLIGVAFVLALVLMSLSRILGPYRPNTNKLSPYESGMDPVGEAKERYSIAFYLVAMEFIVFDLEVVFIYPWAVRFMEHGTGTFIAMTIFIVVLFIGLVYTLKKGTLDWDVKNIKYEALSK
ncbi:NADH-quinone oxidoreductase subunit A [Rhodohalobacter barkolensis]|jgi:NADH-quinone oxidoreductase subunit A|uniref:NADH-quinone oxidoreductase subunit A n=1 Tax=Rhodohalobacter barkolensis TaxID=2053187 RepID=A0A2N0VKP7_9BACT|nr:NADH-quinone oxidoreductase subunit A [Rhodohalobacter barkolensis]PKD44731.1 NADH-quinone oxidoreductase subunit A [Rhodohalobacter barkolensis]